MADTVSEKRTDAAPSLSPSESSTTLASDNVQQQRHDSDLEKAVTAPIPEQQPDVNRYRSALDWEGEHDPENPTNWALWKKAYHVTVVGVQCFVMQVSHRPVNGV